ncbi:MAG: DNA polymerase III subunit delta' [Clostridia bacterium]|nr:DNA polymerase III subunit delta' [Clostridia bacterium]
MYGYDIYHEDIMDKLITSIRKGMSHHAYIFEGERGAGSMEAAKLFAVSLICEKKEVTPCGNCNSCILAKAGNHPDIHILSPLKDKKNIIVDQIRDLLKDAYKKPFESERKVYIIAYGDEMNEQAQNAFLKLLEEPPEYAVFVILAENTESLLLTVRSRCERVKFPPVSSEKIKIILEKSYPNTKNIDFLARYSGGNIEKAKQLAEEEGFMPLRQGAFELLPKILSKSVLESYDVAEFVENNKEDAQTVLELWQDFLRDIILIQNNAEKFAVNTDYIDKLINLSGRTEEKTAVSAMTEIIKAQEMLKRAVNLHTLVLNMAFGIKRGENK